MPAAISITGVIGALIELLDAEFVKGTLNLVLRLNADHSFGNTSVIEEQESRQHLNTVLLPKCRTQGGIDFGNDDRVFVFVRNGFQNRQQHPTGTATRPPEIDDHGNR